MFSAPRMISLRVPNLEDARRWYGGVLGREPAFDAPFAVVFAVGDCAVILLPREDAAHSDERCVPFLGVDDIETAYTRLIDAGATARSEITFTT